MCSASGFSQIRKNHGTIMTQQVDVIFQTNYTQFHGTTSNIVCK